MAECASGTYTITAVAKDNWSAETTSAPVTVTVASTGKPLVSNRSSSADINSALNGVLSMKLSPNPAKNILNINTAGLQADKLSIKSLISASGVIMRTIQTGGAGQNCQLDVSSLSSGMYIVKMINGDKIVYRQFVKL